MLKEHHPRLVMGGAGLSKVESGVQLLASSTSKLNPHLYTVPGGILPCRLPFGLLMVGKPAGGSLPGGSIGASPLLLRSVGQCENARRFPPELPVI